MAFMDQLCLLLWCCMWTLELIFDWCAACFAISFFTGRPRIQKDVILIIVVLLGWSWFRCLLVGSVEHRGHEAGLLLLLDSDLLLLFGLMAKLSLIWGYWCCSVARLSFLCICCCIFLPVDQEDLKRLSRRNVGVE